MEDQRIHADLNKWEEVNGEFRVILTTRGTHQDLRKYGVILAEELALSFWMDDEDSEGRLDPLYFDGILRYDEGGQHWVAVVDRRSIRNASALKSTDFDSAVAHEARKPMLAG